jgi:toxin ParE1/3/4
MAHIELAPEVFDDFDPASAPQRIGEILEAIQILTHSPRSGDP